MLLLMYAVLLILGMFVDTVSTMMLTIPIFVPLANVLGFEPVWFGTIIQMSIEMSGTTPPFGLLLYDGCSGKGHDAQRGRAGRRTLGVSLES